MAKHRWTYAEDFYCCLHYLWSVFEYVGDDSLTTLVNMLAEDIPHIDRGSLRMKLQNIKAIALDLGLEDRLTFTPLNNYSRQCKRAFVIAQDCLCGLKDMQEKDPKMEITRDLIREFLFSGEEEVEFKTPDFEIYASDDTAAFSSYKMISKEEREALRKTKGERKIKNVR